MILADTSAWIEYDRATGSAVDKRLTTLITNEAMLVVTEPVLMEVLAGARTQAREEDLRRAAAALRAAALRLGHRLRRRSAHLPTVPPRRHHTSRAAGLHDRGRRVAPQRRLVVLRR